MRNNKQTRATKQGSLIRQVFCSRCDVLSIVQYISSCVSFNISTFFFACVSTQQQFFIFFVNLLKSVPSMAKVAQIIKLEDSAEESTPEVFEIRDEDVRQLVICDRSFSAIFCHTRKPVHTNTPKTHTCIHTYSYNN